MFFTIFLSYLPYACVTAYTPQPNNIPAIYAMSQYCYGAHPDLLRNLHAHGTVNTKSS